MGLTHIGQITSHKGLKGNLTLKVKNKFDFDLKNLKFIYAEIKSNKIPFEIEKINIVKEGVYLVKILEYENREASNHLIKKKIFLDEKLIINKLKELESIIGFNIIEKNKKIGKVKDYYNQEQPILFCKIGNKEVMIPYVKDIVEKRDDIKKNIYVNLPKGLLDLN